LKLRGLISYLVVAMSVVASAQAQVSLPLAPKPGQILHVVTTQEFSINLDQSAATPGVEILNKVTLGFTQTNGSFDDQGQMKSQLTIERIEVEETVNGTKKTSDDSEKFVGQSVTAVFDRAGKLTNIEVPKHLQQSSARFRTPIAAAYGALTNFPATTLSVGQSASAPWEIPLRMPGSTTQAPYRVQTFITLRAIEKDGDARVARLDQRIESTPDADQFKVEGAGTFDLNLDRGFVAGTKTDWTITGSYQMKGSSAAAQPSNVRATMKLTMTANE
jgi:hypothetical protein